MSTKTKNLNLIKPEEDDYVNIKDINNNMDIIDEKLATESKKIDGMLSGTASSVEIVTVQSGTIRNNSASGLIFKISSKDNETLQSIKDKSPTIINANVIAKTLDGVGTNNAGIPSSYNVESTKDEYSITVYSGSSSVAGQYLFAAVVTIAYERDINDIRLAELKNMCIGEDGTVYDNAGDALRGQIGQLKESLGNQEVYSEGLKKSAVLNDAITETLYTGSAKNAPDTINKMYNSKNNHWQQFDSIFLGIVYEVKEGEQYVISGTSLNERFQLVNFFDTLETDRVLDFYPKVSDTYSSLKVVMELLTVPKNANYMLLNTHQDSTITVEKVTGYKDFKSETEKTLTDLNNSDDLKDFQIKNLQQRLFDTGKYNDFAFKEFDKTYFAFVIDDSNKTLYPIYKIFHDKGVKLSSATIPGNLNIAVEGIGTNKDVLDLIVADGGEVLVHYYGNLIDIGEQAPDTDRTYLNTVEDWDSRIVVTKKALEDMGYKIRGVIRADYTSSRTKTGEQYCREYYDYSDGLGTSPQYTLTRMFVHNFSTVEDFKKWIDKCCEKPGFYPICTHGSESVNDNMDEILDYILNKDNCECTTYKDVYDQFRSTVLENRIKALEEKVSG